MQQETKQLFSRSFREGSVQVWRNKFLSWSTILLGGLIIFLLNVAFSVQFFADYSLRNLESRADFVVELRSTMEAFDFQALENELQQNFSIETALVPGEKVEEVNISPQLHLRFLDLTQVGDIFQVLKKPRYDSVIGSWDREGERDFVNLIEKLTRVRGGVEKTSRLLVIFFLGGGILLMMHTFRMVLFSRKDEVFIARLVGAQPRFIAGPFLVEGLLLGSASSLLGIVAFVFVLRELPLLPGGEIFLYLWNTVFPLEMICAIGVGVLGALLAVRKYLSGTMIYAS